MIALELQIKGENMKILILHGSARTNGVTGQLADKFMDGTKDAGYLMAYGMNIPADVRDTDYFFD